MYSIYTSLWEELCSKGQALLLTTMNGTIEKRIICGSALVEQYTSPCLITDDKKNPALVEPFCRPERLILLGGGHVSLCLAEFASRIGFTVVVVDDREGFACRERFPWARQTICGDFDRVIRDLAVTSGDYVVVVTRGHQNDAACLQALWQSQKPRYIGMIGSRRKTAMLRDKLLSQGIGSDWFDAIYTPIGLSIGAVTPEEIAISILAELIQVKRQGNRHETGTVRPEISRPAPVTSDIDHKVLQILAIPPEEKAGLHRAIVTIVSASGSSPRKAGAKMIVYQDGSICGTIGGGRTEGDMITKALQMMEQVYSRPEETPAWEICDVTMHADLAAEEGLICGGSMKILIEVDLTCTGISESL